MSWRTKLYQIRGLIWLVEVVAATLTAVYFLLGTPQHSFCWFKIRSTSDKADAFLFALMLKVPESKKYFELEQWAQLKVKGNE